MIARYLLAFLLQSSQRLSRKELEERIKDVHPYQEKERVNAKDDGIHLSKKDEGNDVCHEDHDPEEQEIALCFERWFKGDDSSSRTHFYQLFLHHSLSITASGLQKKLSAYLTAYFTQINRVTAQ